MESARGGINEGPSWFDGSLLSYLCLLLLIHASKMMRRPERVTEERWQIGGQLIPQISLDARHARVEGRVLWHRLRVPLPSLVFPA
jgi:hypothetical protein